MKKTKRKEDHAKIKMVRKQCNLAQEDFRQEVSINYAIGNRWGSTLLRPSSPVKAQPDPLRVDTKHKRLKLSEKFITKFSNN